MDSISEGRGKGTRGKSLVDVGGGGREGTGDDGGQNLNDTLNQEEEEETNKPSFNTEDQMYDYSQRTS